MDTHQKVTDHFKELTTIAETTEGSFFGFFETDKEYIVKTYGSGIDFTNVLIGIAQKDDDLKASILLAALEISINLNKH